MSKPEKPEKKIPYHENLPEWPDFALPKNDTDGRLPSCRVKGWKEFVDHMQSLQHNFTGGEMVYRGQRYHRWGLSSTLSRALQHRYFGKSSEEMRKDLLEQFKLAMRGRGPNLESLSEKELWALGQHNGLHTPLLDWTKSPFVALYFAFLDPNPDPLPNNEKIPNTSRAVFCLNMSRLREIMPDLFFEPVSNENARLVNQAGLFTLTPPDEKDLVSYIIRTLVFNKAIQSIEPKDEGPFEIDETAIRLSQYLCKIHIPNSDDSDREECLDMLRKMNIHHGSLFPDLTGAAHYCNDWLRRFKEDKGEREYMERIAQNSESDAEPYIKKIKDGANLRGLIKAVIREHIDQDTVPDKTVADWIIKLVRHYKKHMVPYWPVKPMAHYKIRTEIREQIDHLMTNFIMEERSLMALILSNDLIAVFLADHRVNHYPGLGKKNKSKPQTRKR